MVGGRLARCHPRRKHKARGLCERCYQRQYDRRRNLRFRYGLTVAQYDALRRRQRNACAICKRKTTTPLHVDHDHKTRLVRGLLCPACNLALGHFEDDPVRCRRAARYLTRTTPHG